jgi:glycosyltransferase involved in cell wall biosynthesis
MHRPFTVVMAGSGELEEKLRAFCAEHALDNVVLTGFINQSDLPGLYAASDVFVLPAENEPWGLAVNENKGLRQRQGRKSLARILQRNYHQCLEGIRLALIGLELRGSRTNPVLQTTGT